MIAWKRVFRTSSSERFVGVRNGIDVAAIDLHYLDRTVAGTVVLFAEAKWKQDEVPPLLASFDEDLLPGVDLASGSLTFTVVHGDVWGNFEAAGRTQEHNEADIVKRG
jgi:hypothetical protein